VEIKSVDRLQRRTAAVSSNVEHTNEFAKVDNIFYYSAANGSVSYKPTPYSTETSNLTLVRLIQRQTAAIATKNTLQHAIVICDVSHK
jgi:hypothetical protein